MNIEDVCVVYDCIVVMDIFLMMMEMCVWVEFLLFESEVICEMVRDFVEEYVLKFNVGLSECVSWIFVVYNEYLLMFILS